MEGMPRFAPILPDLKKPANGYDDEFVYSLKEYILLHFQDDPDNYDNAIIELRNIKEEILKCHLDVEAVCILKRYFAQLLMMKNRFPMEQGGAVQANFAWYERALEMPTAQSYKDINFEMACVMYQIGAIHAVIAGQEKRQSDDSIKNAFMHFQYAAWPLQYIRDTMDVAAFGTSDFDKELLTFHVNVLLAQAQECLLEKSLLDPKRSPLIVVKLAAYLRDLYSQCHTLLRNSNTVVEVLTSKKYKLWSRTVAIKSEIYGAIAMLYMSYKEEQEQHFGNRLAWCQAADHYLSRALTIVGDDAEYIETVSFVRDVVKGRLENAKKENDFIYHERVPKFEELLVTVEGEGKVKPRAFDPLDPSIGGDDLFGSLVPPTVLASVSQYEEEKAKLKREIFQRVHARDLELDEYMESLNADELGLKTGHASFVPSDDLLKRNASMNSLTDAVPSLLKKLQNVDDIARDCDSELHSLEERLDAVDNDQLRSDEGFKAILGEIKRLLGLHVKARGLNGELHKALAAHSTNIHLLSLPLSELVEKIAPRNEALSPANSKEGEALMRVLDKVTEMKNQRSMLINNFVKELDRDNINKKLLAERDTDNSELFATELKKHDKNVQYIDLNLAAQDNIMQYLTEANADFSEQRKLIQLITKKQTDQVLSLCAAYDIYMDILHKADDGKKFYDDLIKRTANLKEAVDAITKTYFEEKEKIDKERREIEEKKAALLAARDAQNALADFGRVSQSQSIPSSAVSAASGQARPRLGDYMQFYKNKMAAKGTQNYIQTPMPPYVAIAEHSPSSVPPQAPSPAPSSIGGDMHGEVQFQPIMYGQQLSKQYAPPFHSNYPMQYKPTEQPANFQNQYFPPTEQYYSPMNAHILQEQGRQQIQSSQPINSLTYQQYGLPAVPNQTPSSVPSNINRIYQPMAAEVNKTTYSPIPTPTPEQQQMNYQIPQQEMTRQQIQPTSPIYQHQHIQPMNPSTFQNRPFQPVSNQTPSPVSPIVNMNYQQIPSEANRSASSTFPPATSEHQMYHQTSPQQIQPAPSAHQLPAPRDNGHQQFHPNSSDYQTAHQQANQGAFQLSVSSQQPFNQPQLGMPVNQQQFSVPQAQQTPFSTQTRSPVPAVNPIIPNPTSAFRQPQSLPQLQQVSSQSQQYASSQMPTQFMNAPSYQINYGLQTMQKEEKPLPPVSSNPPSQTVQRQPEQSMTPVQQAPTVTNQSNQSLQAPWNSRPPMQTGQSPWHSNQHSPWHQPAQSTFISTSTSSHLPSQETPVQAQGAPQTNNAPPTSNVDLLSSLLGDLNLPPAITPNQISQPQRMEYQGYQQAAPSQTRPQATLSNPKEIPVMRPAAAVIPMQQKSAPKEIETSILAMSSSTTVSIAPQNSSVSQMTDLSKFNIGESDKNRLEKQHLHTAIKSNDPLWIHLIH